MTGIIQNAECRRKMKFEALGKACLEVYEGENVWQAVEQYRLQFRSEILRKKHAGMDVARDMADFEEITEMCDYFAAQLATQELMGGVA